jgi:hypothetical protein
MAEDEKKRTDTDRISDAILKTLAALDNVDEEDDKTEDAKKLAILKGFTHWLLKRPAVCLECQVKLDPKLRELCPKHTAFAVGTDYIRNKAKEHGPRLAVAAMGKATELFEKYLGETEAKDPSDDFTPPEK